jgi:hypothetical protein
MRRVLIKWYDAYTPESDKWQGFNDAVKGIEEPMLCETVGYVFKETDKAYLVANTFAWNDDPAEPTMSLLCGLLHIPKGCVDSIEDIVLEG